MDRSKRILQLIPAIGILAVATTGIAAGLPAPPLPPLPSGMTAVHVQAGKTVTGIDAAITPGSVISGTITAEANGAPLSGIYVYAFTERGSGYLGVSDLGSTTGTGAYSIIGLAPSATGYYVCAIPQPGFGGPSAYGYVPRCFGSTENWDGKTAPASADTVPTTIGATTAGINIALPSAGAIAGRVTDRAGTGLQYTRINLYTAAGLFLSKLASRPSYRLDRIPPGQYRVCFSAELSRTGPTGFLSQCYPNVAWNGGTVPATAKVITVSGGKLQANINAVLSPAGAISGTVRAAINHQPLIRSYVQAFRSGRAVAHGWTNAAGRYRIVGLRTGSYLVCARGGHLTGSATDYNVGRCYRNIGWSSSVTPASNATAVSVRIGGTHAGIDFFLAHKTVPRGAIAGTVRTSAGAPLRGVRVYVPATADVNYTFTTVSGTYRLPLAPSRTGYLVCFDGADAVPAGSRAPASGYASVCYKQAFWVDGAFPAHPTRVPVAAGVTQRGINATLRLGGAITGVVSYESVGLSEIPVDVINSQGQRAGQGLTGFDGSYRVKGLTPAPSGYRVCFEALQYIGTVAPASPTGYLSQCYQNAYWNSWPYMP